MFGGAELDRKSLDLSWRGRRRLDVHAELSPRQLIVDAYDHPVSSTLLTAHDGQATHVFESSDKSRIDGFEELSTSQLPRIGNAIAL